ncbi:proton-conducting transporter transmembrane domain-containing protein [Geomonas oryzisoli]|uniref:proton-conducting transporter transmembrane domain-containing protein n=1 Tax=Geomonas oryzisoli TaxID=2847992 RepID=UPI001EF082FE|nr:proton-conducting transporter membrane subunit [Geomonas oryzisoli]
MLFFDMMRDPAILVLCSIALAGCSGLPGLVLRDGTLGQRLASVAALTSSLLALPSLLYLLIGGGEASFLLNWNLPFGPCEVALDPLSLFFLIPIFLIFPAGSLYALGYWPAASHSSQRSVTFFYGLLACAMALVVVSRNGALFVMAWEIMALSGYFLLVAEHREGEVRGAGTVYLVASHLGGAALLVLFASLFMITGSFGFPAAGSLAVGAGLAATLFWLVLAGFGSKAGIMPLHLWLPSAHANAPSHVSALLSGVMLKIGIYGILRVISFFTERPLWWGGVLTVAGLGSAVMGICVASAQKDIKRLLAYSSIENLGIISAGIGMFLLGDGTGNQRLAFLGLAGALFHVLNHVIFKPLLFFCAGSVMHATGTRDLDRMGGLARRLPYTAFFTLCGAVAICGLPPFNGFASEMLLYLGFFGEARAGQPFVALGAPVLALVGGVAVISFVKLYGIAFLGEPRTAAAAEAHEATGTMLAPIALLACLALTGGLFPQLFLALVQPAMRVLAPGLARAAVLPIAPVWFALAGVSVICLAAILYLFLKAKTGGSAVSAPTWGCGYLRPSPRIQYTGSSFGAFFSSLSGSLIRTRITVGQVAGLTPAAVRLSYHPEETLLHRVVLPVLNVLGIGCAFVRRLQHGEVQIYILYIFVTLMLLLLWVH